MEGHHILCDKPNTYTRSIIILSDNWHHSVFRQSGVKRGGVVATAFQIRRESEVMRFSPNTAVNASFLPCLKSVLEMVCSAHMQTSRLRSILFIARRIYFGGTENIFIKPLS